MEYCIQAKRFVAIINLLFPLLLLTACSGPFTSQQPIISSTADTGGTPIGAVGGGQIDGTSCPVATGIQIAGGTSVVYQSLEQQVSKGNALVLSLPGDTSQVVGLFHTQDDLNSYIAQHNATHLPLYQQHMYSGPSILVLQQVNQDAYDLVILQGNAQGGNPSYDCRVVPNNQINQVIQQLTSLHTELQGVQPLKLSDYKFTLPTDQIFA
jgi:hypothetical protein